MEDFDTTFVESVTDEVAIVTESLLPPTGAPYWTKSEIDSHTSSRLPQWARDSLTSFRRVILDQKFPCMFATTSELHEQLVYSFVNTAKSDRDIDHIRNSIIFYLNSLKDIPAHKVDFQVLVIFIKPMPGISLAEYGTIAQTLLQSLHDRDLVPWPAEIPTYEDDPLWSFAFHGRPLFVNISTPANRARLSRNVGPGMTLIISPRDVFDRVAGPTEKGRKIRSLIRARTQAYDRGLPFAPWSSFAYGQGEVGTERSQYILSDDNEKPISLSIKQCPSRSRT